MELYHFTWLCVFVVGSCESSGIGISRSQQGERDIGVVAERDETTAATDAGTPSNKRKRPHVRHSHPHPHSLLHSHTQQVPTEPQATGWRRGAGEGEV